MIRKRPDDAPPLEPARIEEEKQRLSGSLLQFQAEMERRLHQKAADGWTGWDEPTSRNAIYTSLLAHAAGVPFARGQEVDIANFAMMLWCLERAHD